MVSPPMSASRCVRFTMPMPNTMSVTCWGSELTRLRRLPPAPGGLLGVLGSCCSFSNITLQNGSEVWRPVSVNLDLHVTLKTASVLSLIKSVMTDAPLFFFFFIKLGKFILPLQRNGHYFIASSVTAVKYSSRINWNRRVTNRRNEWKGVYKTVIMKEVSQICRA